jgi:hypothetical protein
MGKLNIDSATLFRQIDECARKMAVIMGERCEARPRRLAKLFSVLEVEETDPVRYKHYPEPTVTEWTVDPAVEHAFGRNRDQNP